MGKSRIISSPHKQLYFSVKVKAVYHGESFSTGIIEFKDSKVVTTSEINYRVIFKSIGLFFPPRSLRLYKY